MSEFTAQERALIEAFTQMMRRKVPDGASFHISIRDNEVWPYFIKNDEIFDHGKANWTQGVGAFIEAGLRSLKENEQ